MQSFPLTIIWRHRRENLKKCTLSPLNERKDLQFVSYPTGQLPPLKGYLFLTLDAPLLNRDDADKGLFLIDATWRRAEVMTAQIQGVSGLLPRSLPPYLRTAYPRRQEDCADPSRGLASIEALFIAYQILGRPTEGLLDSYHWKNPFLEANGLRENRS